VRDKLNRLRPVLLERARQFRRPLTPMEQRLWNHLRDRRCGGYKFRRQTILDRYIADFHCAEAKLVVEADGRSHDGTQEHDAARDEWLARRGYHTLRVLNTDVRGSLEGESAS